MEYADEKILSLLHEAEKAKQPNNICTGPVKVGNRYYEFEPQLFFESKLSVYIPKDFQDMPDNIRKIKYPYEQRPQIIKSDETGGINITLSQLDQVMQEEWVKQLTDGMKAMIKKANPTNVFYSDGVEIVHEKQIGYFEFKSPALDGSIYNLMFFLEFDGQVVMGTFCCHYDDYDKWRDIAFQLIRTIRIIQADDVEGERV